MALTVQFTDQSTPGPSGPITDWAWDFGDGGTSTSQNPSHTYAAAGTYDVQLTVTGTSPDGTASVTISTPVSGTSTTPPHAAFSSSISGLAVTFTDASTAGSSGPITAHHWDFGDGNTSTSTSPSHTYAASGTYNVTLMVTGTSPDGTSSVTHSVAASSGGGVSKTYWGARINGMIYQNHYGASNGRYAPWCASDPHPNSWDYFETHAGKEVCSIQWGGSTSQGLAFAFDQTAQSRTHSRHAFSQYDLGPTKQQLLDLAANSNTNGAITQATNLANAMKSSGNPIMFRPMWEMNGNWGYAWQSNSISTTTYVAAWRKLHDLFVSAGADNVTFFWCPNVMVGEPDPTPWYPGSGYVDWVGFDGYNQGGNISPDQLFNTTLAKVQSIAPGKPVGIGETGCYAVTSYSGGKASWITAFFAWMVAHPEVRWFSWFNDFPESVGNYIEEGNGTTTWSGNALTAFRAGIADARYLSAPAGGFTSNAKVPVPS